MAGDSPPSSEFGPVPQAAAPRRKQNMRTADLLSSSAPRPEDGWINNLVLTGGVESHATCTLASTTSDDSLRMFDPTTLQAVVSINTVHEGVTCLKPFDAGQACVLTAGSDAVVRCWDLRSGKSELELRNGAKIPYISLDAHGHEIAIGTEFETPQASILIWDSRSPRSPLLQYTESHSDDITEVRFHPTIPTCLLSGSTDGLINIYDTTITDEDDALIQVMNHGSSVSHASFLSATHVYSLSHDETLSIYELETDPDGSAPYVPARVFGDLRPSLKCDYVVDAIASAGFDGAIAIVGAGSHIRPGEEHFDLHYLSSSPDWSFKLEDRVRLRGAHGEDVIRSLCFSQTASTIYTGGEDGLVRAWRVKAKNTSEVQGPEIEKDKKLLKKKRKKTDGKERFKPY